MKKFIPFLLIFIFCSNDFPPEGAEFITPIECFLSIEDNYDTKVPCDNYRDTDLNAFVWQRPSNSESCDNARFTFYFDDDVNIDYISLVNLNARKDFKTRDRLRILEVTYDDFEFIRDSLYPNDTRETQYLKIDRKETNQVNIDIVRTYSSEKYLTSDARNECGVKFIQFWSQS
tara:strand:- start:451 stop:972 length:522 start_codon:yes stop_codon:yes gene_type:complete